MLTATQERPIFSASRRPPPRAVAGPRIEPVIVPVAKPAEPEQPALALIGAVVGDNDAIAVFLDRTNQKIVRLRSGDAHAGWVLSSVQGREVTLKKAEQTEVLALQRSDGAVASPGFPGIPAVVGIPGPPPPMPTVAGVEGSYAPFVPRSTPKNGEFGRALAGAPCKLFFDGSAQYLTDPLLLSFAEAEPHRKSDQTLG